MSRPQTEDDLYQILDRIEERLDKIERFPPPHFEAPEYTVATLPLYTDVRPGLIVYVRDAAAGNKYQGATSTGWVSLG